MTESKNIKVVAGDILEAKEQFLAHQTNCTTSYARGLASQIFKKFPEADIYKKRKNIKDHSKPGTITVIGRIINMNGQYSPGRPRGSDTAEKRELYFTQCLAEILKIKDIESIAFPFTIGCGLAGGNWDHYLKMIEDFAEGSGIICRIYKI